MVGTQLGGKEKPPTNSNPRANTREGRQPPPQAELLRSSVQREVQSHQPAYALTENNVHKTYTVSSQITLNASS